MGTDSPVFSWYRCLPFCYQLVKRDWRKISLCTIQNWEVTLHTLKFASKGFPHCWAQGFPQSATLAADPHPCSPPTPRAHTHHIPQAPGPSTAALSCAYNVQVAVKGLFGATFSVMTFWLIWTWDYPHGDFWPGPHGFQPGFTNIVGKRFSSQRCAWIIPPGVIKGLRKLPAHQF